LGVVGAGPTSRTDQSTDEVPFIIILILITVALIDQVSARIRRLLIA
jgi:ABC-type phosphate/phosphonate transport system permease subunit